MFNSFLNTFLYVFETGLPVKHRSIREERMFGSHKGLKYLARKEKSIYFH